MINSGKSITYIEFGVKTEILDYVPFAPKLNGMKDRKPFVQDNEIRINVDDRLCKVTKVNFYNEVDQKISRDEVCLDTETRIAGIIINKANNVLVLKVNKDQEYYCFPGGHLRECENVDECLKREMFEETGIDISDYKHSLLLETHFNGFGPEKFFLIRTEDAKISFRDENPRDGRYRLMLIDINGLKKLKNVLPGEVIYELTKIVI